MGRDLYCPLCGALQKLVNLDETENLFVCDKCEAEIKVIEIYNDNAKFGYKVIAKGKVKEY